MKHFIIGVEMTCQEMVDKLVLLSDHSVVSSHLLQWTIQVIGARFTEVRGHCIIGDYTLNSRNVNVQLSWSCYLSLSWSLSLLVSLLVSLSLGLSLSWFCSFSLSLSWSLSPLVLLSLCFKVHEIQGVKCIWFISFLFVVSAMSGSWVVWDNPLLLCI